MTLTCLIRALDTPTLAPPGGLPYKRDGKAGLSEIYRIKPLKDTSLGEVYRGKRVGGGVSFFGPLKGTIFYATSSVYTAKTVQLYDVVLLLTWSPKGELKPAKIGVLIWTRDTKLRNFFPYENNEHRRTFRMGIPLGYLCFLRGGTDHLRYILVLVIRHAWFHWYIIVRSNLTPLTHPLYSRGSILEFKETGAKKWLHCQGTFRSLGSLAYIC